MVKSLSRKDNHRKSLMRNLLTSLVLYEEIKTTSVKAKEVRPMFEKLINKVKKDANSFNSKRLLKEILLDENAIKKVIEVIAPRYKSEKSGFTMIYRVGPRLGDGAEMSIIRLKPIKIQKVEEKDIKEKVTDASKKDGKTTRTSKSKAGK